MLKAAGLLLLRRRCAYAELVVAAAAAVLTLTSFYLAVAIGPAEAFDSRDDTTTNYSG